MTQKSSTPRAARGREAGPRPPRPAALVIEREAAGTVDAELRKAVREDLLELLSALKLRVEPEFAAQTGAPRLLVFADVPAMPALAVEGALESLRSVDVVIGPCADGSLYLLGLAPGLEQELAAELSQAARQGLEAVTSLLEDAELDTVVLPPWFRLAGAADLKFAEWLARLSLLSEEGEEDFIADRLRVWLEAQE
jgi:glycosyltransferase A (GT-A) superfamily protein (DUF2064 family)